MEKIILYYDQNETSLDLVTQCYEMLLDTMWNCEIKLIPIEVKLNEKIIQQE